MANMSHCRFHNTLADLRDCEEHMDEPLPLGEAQARAKLLLLCARIAADYECEIEELREQKSWLKRRPVD